MENPLTADPMPTADSLLENTQVNIFGSGDHSLNTPILSPHESAFAPLQSTSDDLAKLGP